MAIRNLRRQSAAPLNAPGTPDVAPIFVDSDDSLLYINPSGSGTTYKEIPTVASTQRKMITDVVAISGTALHSANLTIWTAPANAIVTRVILDITTQSTGASTIDIGYTATTATTSSDTFLDGVSGAAVAQFDSMNAALDSGANAKAQNAASGKWITADEASGDTTALVGNVYIQYFIA